MSTQDPLLGDHNVSFYASTKEKNRVLLSNLRVGLDRACSALYLADGENIEQAQIEMESFGLKLDQPRLKIMPSHKFYTPDGEFHLDRVVEQFKSLADKSVDMGFEGLYVSADAANTLDYLTEKGMVEEWFRYENAPGRTFKFPMEAICAYRTDQVKSNGQALLQLLQAHKNTVIANSLDFIDNEKVCVDVITGELMNTLGREAAQIVLRFMERNLKIPRNQIPDRIEDFNRALELILGKGASILEKKILENLHGKIGLE